jgi:hypothetical protein
MITCDSCGQTGDRGEVGECKISLDVPDRSAFDTTPNYALLDLCRTCSGKVAVGRLVEGVLSDMKRRRQHA